MKTKITTSLLGIGFLLLGVVFQSFAQSQDVSSNLEVYHITTNGNGEEVTEKVTSSSPGDTLEYRLTYTNNLGESISNLQPVLPIPIGVEFIANTADPELSSASLNNTGNTFQSLPIQRLVTREDGEEVQQEVPAEEYQRLRWMVSSLGSQQSVTLTARVHVINE